MINAKKRITESKEIVRGRAYFDEVLGKVSLWKEHWPA